MAVLLRHPVPGLLLQSTGYDSILIKKKLIRRYVYSFIYWLGHCLGLSLPPHPPCWIYRCMWSPPPRLVICKDEERKEDDF